MHQDQQDQLDQEVILVFQDQPAQQVHQVRLAVKDHKVDPDLLVFKDQQEVQDQQDPVVQRDQPVSYTHLTLPTNREV